MISRHKTTTFYELACMHSFFSHFCSCKIGNLPMSLYMPPKQTVFKWGKIKSSTRSFIKNRNISPSGPKFLPGVNKLQGHHPKSHYQPTNHNNYYYCTALLLYMCNEHVLTMPSRIPLTLFFRFMHREHGFYYVNTLKDTISVTFTPNI